MSTLKHTQAAAEFVHWFETMGHWVYDYRAEAVRVWKQWGIEGRPNYTPALGAELQRWVDSDPLPALVAKWNAERAAIAKATGQEGGGA